MSGQISKLTNEIDKLKFKVDSFHKDELEQLGTSTSERTNVFHTTQQLLREVEALNKKLSALSPENDVLPASKFIGIKSTEQKRLKLLKSRLDTVTNELEPDEVEEEYFRSLSPKPRKQVNIRQEFGENSEEEYEDEEEEEEEESECEDDKEEYEPNPEEVSITENISTSYIYRTKALADFKGGQQDDLLFSKGDIIYITETSEDGWWTGYDKQKNSGLVPSTLVQIIEEAAQKKESPRKRSGQELWGKLTEKKEDLKTSVTDVLKAMKAVPSGFRAPTLGKLANKDENQISDWLIPKTGASNIQFDDLLWDPINKKLRTYPVTVCRTISLVSVRSIPPPGTGIEVLSRHVCIALWDGKKILSNIHIIRCVPVDNGETWSFSPKITKFTPTLYDGDLLIRTDNQSRDISVLLELNYTYMRMSTGEVSEISCGWATLPLYEQKNLTPITNRTSMLEVNGGTPFEKGIALDNTVDLKTSQSLLQSLARNNRQPRMVVKTTSFNKLDKETFDFLPKTLVTCLKYAPLIGYYRQQFASVYVDDFSSTALTCDSVLAYFPKVVNYSDLMDSILYAWTENRKTSLKRSQRKDIEHLLGVFKQSVMQSVFPLLQSNLLAKHVWADEKTEKARYSVIMQFVQRRDPLGGLLNPGQYKPFDLNKISVRPFSNKSLHRPDIGVNDVT